MTGLPELAEMLLTRSASSPLPSPLSFLAFFFFLQNFLFRHLFFLLSAGAEAGADVDASSLPRTPPAGAEADGEQQHAPALRRNFLPLLHLLAADEKRPIAGPTREWAGRTLGSIRAKRVARFLGDTSTLTRAESVDGNRVLFLDVGLEGASQIWQSAECSSLSVPVRIVA